MSLSLSERTFVLVHPNLRFVSIALPSVRGRVERACATLKGVRRFLPVELQCDAPPGAWDVNLPSAVIRIEGPTEKPEPEALASGPPRNRGGETGPRASPDGTRPTVIRVSR